MSRLFRFMIAALLIAAPAAAQPATAQKQADAKTADREALARAEEQRRANEAQPINVRIELTITDQRGEGATVVKTVSVMTADRYWGRIRTQGELRNAATGARFPVILNVDARPTLIRETRARVEFTIEYRPADDVTSITRVNPATASDSTTPNINESLAVILEDGKSILISQSADPVTDRKVKVEAKMTLVK